jgi:hypothetical protein
VGGRDICIAPICSILSSLHARCISQGGFETCCDRLPTPMFVMGKGRGVGGLKSFDVVGKLHVRFGHIGGTSDQKYHQNLLVLRRTHQHLRQAV